MPISSRLRAKKGRKSRADSLLGADRSPNCFATSEHRRAIELRRYARTSPNPPSWSTGGAWLPHISQLRASLVFIPEGVGALVRRHSRAVLFRLGLLPGISCFSLTSPTVRRNAPFDDGARCPVARQSRLGSFTAVAAAPLRATRCGRDRYQVTPDARLAVTQEAPGTATASNLTARTLRDIHPSTSLGVTTRSQ